MQNALIDSTIARLYQDSQNDYLKMIKGMAKRIFRPLLPSDFEEAYLAISNDQGKDLVKLIQRENIKNVVEFGASFGISTLFLAQGISETGGRIITTELLESKANRALQNFRAAKVDGLIEMRIGDAMTTLKSHNSPIDLLLLDGWKDLYLPIFRMLEPNFHTNTIIYVDNADMSASQELLRAVQNDPRYQLNYKFSGKVAIIRGKRK